ncbi:MAG: hypothetical protein KKB50_11945 [Planctomycetes bacterium]|nr:hypothetical protein [Planctomycetota bacterium]
MGAGFAFGLTGCPLETGVVALDEGRFQLLDSARPAVYEAIAQRGQTGIMSGGS